MGTELVTKNSGPRYPCKYGSLSPSPQQKMTLGQLVARSTVSLRQRGVVNYLGWCENKNCENKNERHFGILAKICNAKISRYTVYTCGSESQSPHYGTYQESNIFHSFMQDWSRNYSIVARAHRAAALGLLLCPKLLAAYSMTFATVIWYPKQMNIHSCKKSPHLLAQSSRLLTAENPSSTLQCCSLMRYHATRNWFLL